MFCTAASGTCNPIITNPVYTVTKGVASAVNRIVMVQGSTLIPDDALSKVRTVEPLVASARDSKFHQKLGERTILESHDQVSPVRMKIDQQEDQERGKQTS